MGSRSKTVGVGLLDTGGYVVFISGFVAQADCRWVLGKLDDLIAAGETELVFDYSCVQNVATGWFASEIRRRKMQHQGRVKISLRKSTWEKPSASTFTKSLFAPSLLRLVIDALSVDPAPVGE